MSDFNLEWLEQNFKGKSSVLYNIGCADLSDDSLRFQMCLPDAKVYSFDCADDWKDQNHEKSKIYNLHYLHKAVSFEDTTREFVQGHWEYSGTLSTLDTVNQSKKWREKIQVDVISLNTFCQSNPLPDILHIDTEGNEYNILNNFLPNHRPGVVWAENWDYYNDKNYNMIVPYQELQNLMSDHNYKCYKFEGDSLYVKKDSEYTSYIHKNLDTQNWSAYEKSIQKQIWLMRYNLCKEESWPGITEVEDFFSLPQEIQDECILQFQLEPDSRFFTEKG